VTVSGDILNAAEKTKMTTFNWLPDQNIHQFWFAECLDRPETLASQARLWFSVNELTDFQIKRHFGDLFPHLLEADPTLFVEPGKVLAAVLVLDQFSRNIYRSTSKAFAYDEKALEFLDYALSANMVGTLSPIEKAFLYMPLQHAESIARQKQGGKLFKVLVAEATEPYKSYLKGVESFARQHRMIIERFGRFPHRNKILGRKNMSEELEYLNAGANNFGQG